MSLFCVLLQNEMKDAHDALHACKKQAALVQDSLNVRTALLLLTVYPGVWFVMLGALTAYVLWECGVWWLPTARVHCKARNRRTAECAAIL
jgi:hypothetical protein